MHLGGASGFGWRIHPSIHASLLFIPDLDTGSSFFPPGTCRWGDGDDDGGDDDDDDDDDDTGRLGPVFFGCFSQSFLAKVITGKKM